MKYHNLISKFRRYGLAPLLVIAGLLTGHNAYAQAAACAAGETLTTFSFTAGSWTNGSLGPNSFNAGTAPNNVSMTVQFTGGPFNGTGATAGASPKLDTIGNTANTLLAARNGAANNSLIGTITLSFNRPVNKLRFFMMDVDSSNDAGTPSIWQDQIITTGSLNGAAVAPTALAFVGAGIGTTSIVGNNGTATATWNAAPANTGCATNNANCNVQIDYVNPVSQVSQDYREGTAPGVAATNQYVGINTFSYCVPPRAALAKAYSPATVGVGASSTLTFTINNGTGNPAQGNLAFTDTLPAGLTVTGVSALSGAGCTGTPGFTANTVTLTNGWMTPGTASCTFTATVQGVTAGAYTNAAAAFSGAGGALDTAATTATLTVLSNPVVGKAFAAPTVALNGSTTMNITVQNTNTTAITGAAFTDTYPAGMTGALTATAAPAGCTGTLTAAAGSLTLAGGTIPASTTCTYSVVVTGATAGAKTNTTGAVTTTNAGTGAAANATLNVVAPPAISKAFGAASIVPGGTTTLTFTITNPAGNPGNVTGINFNDVLPTTPGAMTVANATTTNTCAGSTWQGRTGAGAFGAPAAGNTEVRLTGLTLATGASCTVSVVITAVTGGTYNNTSGAIAATGPVALTGTTASASLAVLLAPVIGKSFVASNVALNGSTTMNITVQNTNTTAITGAAFTDTYPAGMTGALTATAAPAGCTGTLTAVAGSLTLAGGTIPASTTCTYSVVVTGATAGAKTNTTGAVTTGNAGTGAAANATLNVYAPPTLSKAFGAASMTSGGTTTLTFTLTNPAANPGNVTGINFNDVLPTTPGAMTVANATTTNTCAGSSWQGRTGAGAFGAPAAGNTEVQLTGLTLAAGASCTVSVVVTAVTGGTYNNTSGAIAATAPVVLTGSTAPASLTVSVAAPAISKAFAPAAIAVNGRSVLTFTLSNSNPTALTGTDFTDTYPAGVVNATPLTVGGTCAGVTHTATAGGASFNVTAGTIAPGSCTITVQVTSAGAGSYNNTSSGVLTAQTAVRGAPSNTATLTVVANSLSVTKTVFVVCDGVNFNTNPRSIPGAYVRYEIIIANAAGGLNPLTLTTIGDVLDLNLNFDNDLRTGSASACATSTPESGAAGNGFKLTCAGGTRACNAPVFFTSAADTDAIGIAGSTITLTFGDGPAGAKALPTEAGYTAGELKPGESVTIRFNAIVR